MKVLGIISMIFAIVAIFVPIVGAYLTIVCGLLAAFSAGEGITFGLVAIGINILNIIFLSPSLWVMAGMSDVDNDILLGMGIVFIGVQIIALIVLFWIHKSWKKKQLLPSK